MSKHFSFLFIFSFPVFFSYGQTADGKLQFAQGQRFEVTMQVKSTIAQQAMGQAIDFNIDATGIHSYHVTNSTEDNTTLKHQMDRIIISFDGMGQKKKLDTNEEKDMNSQFGKPLKDLLDRKYDMIIDNYGKTLMVVPEKFNTEETDSRMAIITSMMKDISQLVLPPAKGKASFFQVLPGKPAGVGDAWTETSENTDGKFETAYAIREINDSVIVIEFAATSVTVTKAEMMGNETTTTMNNKSTGKIILDRSTGIIREKLINTESTGNTEAPFGTIPVTSKTSTIITVKPVNP